MVLCIFFNFVGKLVSNRPKADKNEFYAYFLILLENEPKISRRPIKRDLCLLFNFVEKLATNLPKAD
jgi:hypothetical protein